MMNAAYVVAVAYQMVNVTVLVMQKTVLDSAAVMPVKITAVSVIIIQQMIVLKTVLVNMEVMQKKIIAAPVIMILKMTVYRTVQAYGVAQQKLMNVVTAAVMALMKAPVTVLVM